MSPLIYNDGRSIAKNLRCRSLAYYLRSIIANTDDCVGSKVRRVSNHFIVGGLPRLLAHFGIAPILPPRCS